MDILCTDKTGTLTLDKIVLERHLNVYGEDDDEVLKWAYLNSLSSNGIKKSVGYSSIRSCQKCINHLKLEEHYKKIDEIPFDFQRRRMSVILGRKIRKASINMQRRCRGNVDCM